jgi:hypothetical protein
VEIALRKPRIDRKPNAVRQSSAGYEMSFKKLL